MYEIASADIEGFRKNGTVAKKRKLIYATTVLIHIKLRECCGPIVNIINNPQIPHLSGYTGVFF
jgi:hypothetical protein